MVLLSHLSVPYISSWDYGTWRNLYYLKCCKGRFCYYFHIPWYQVWLKFAWKSNKFQKIHSPICIHKRVENQDLQQPILDFLLWLELLSFMTLGDSPPCFIFSLRVDVRSPNNNYFRPTFINSLAKGQMDSMVRALRHSSLCFSSPWNSIPSQQ